MSKPPWRASTISEVARHAAVSVATVSRVINQPELVRASTRARVEATIRDLDYRPNRVASGLRSGAFRMIALLVGDVSQPWYAKLIKAIESALDGWGYSALVYDLDHDVERLVRCLDGCAQQGIEGVIVSTGDALEQPAIRDAMSRLNDRLPLVVTGQELTSVDVPCIVYDDRTGAREATQALMDVAGGPLAFLGVLPNSALTEQRLLGFSDVVGGTDQTIDEWAWASEGLDFQHGYNAVRHHLEQGARPAGLLATNDQLALGAMRALHDFGLRIPADVSVVGFGDTGFSPFTQPSLASVEGSVDEIADLACGALMSLIEKEKAPPLQVVGRSLVFRESCLRPSGLGSEADGSDSADGTSQCRADRG